MVMLYGGMAIANMWTLGHALRRHRPSQLRTPVAFIPQATGVLFLQCLDQMFCAIVKLAGRYNRDSPIDRAR
jgi:hypothetical protein